MLRSFLQALLREVVFRIQVKGGTEFCSSVGPRILSQQSIPPLDMFESQARAERLARHQILGFLWEKAGRFLKLRQGFLKSLMLMQLYSPLESILRIFAILLGCNATDSARYAIAADHGRFWRAIVGRCEGHRNNRG
jgi:hypothetical protein